MGHREESLRRKGKVRFGRLSVTPLSGEHEVRECTKLADEKTHNIAKLPLVVSVKHFLHFHFANLYFAFSYFFVFYIFYFTILHYCNYVRFAQSRQEKS